MVFPKFQAKVVDKNKNVIGYYVYVKKTDKHYIYTGDTEEVMGVDTLVRYEVEPDTLALIK